MKRYNVDCWTMERKELGTLTIEADSTEQCQVYADAECKERIPPETTVNMTISEIKGEPDPGELYRLTKFLERCPYIQGDHGSLAKIILGEGYRKVVA
jgi:hypothetical protein